MAPFANWQLSANMFPSPSLNHSPDGSLCYPVTGGNLSETQTGAGAKFAYVPDLLIGKLVAAKFNPVVKVRRTRHMRPSASIHNAGNSLLGDLKLLANGFLVNSVSHHLKKLNDLVFGELSVAIGCSVVFLLKPRSVGVKNIFRLSYPLKVLKPIVKFVAVDVVGNMLRGWRWTRKGFKDHAMYAKAVLSNLRGSWGNSQVTPCGLKRFKDRAAPNATQRTNLVVSLIAGKRLPSFIINHAKYVVTHARNYNTHQT